MPRITVAVRSAGFVLMMLLANASTGRAQNGSDLSLTGNIGASGELYSMRGIDTRRPRRTARVFAHGAVAIGNVRLPIDLFLSTEDDAARQSIDRLSVGYRSTAFDASIGDAYPVYSPLSLNGILVRGGHAEVRTGPFAARVDAGENQRAVSYDPGRGAYGAYRRFLVASRLSYGDDRYTGAVHAVRGRDDLPSLRDPGPFLRPEDNLVVGVQADARPFGNAFEAVAELDRAMWSPDLRALPSAEGRIPGAFAGVFAERPGTTTGLALRADARWRDAGWNAAASWQRVDPGYRSLGMYVTQPDWEEYRGQCVPPQLLGALAVAVSGGFRHDNLDGAKAFTSRRVDAAVQTTWRVDPTFSLASSYTLAANGNDADDDALRVRNASHFVTIRPSADWGEFAARRHADLTVTYQTLVDGVQHPYGSYAYTRYGASASYTHAFSREASVNGSYAFAQSTSTGSALTAHAVTVGATVAPDTRWNGGATVTFSRDVSGSPAFDNTRTYARLFLGWSPAAALRLDWEATATLYDPTAGTSYREYRSAMTLTHTF